MQKKAHLAPWTPPKLLSTKTVLVMKLTTILLTVTLLQASARGLSQNVTVNADHAPLATIFRSIEKQTKYTFFYQPALLSSGSPVTLHLSNQPLNKVLDSCMAGQPFTWSMEGRIITLETRPLPKPTAQEPEETPPPGSLHVYITDTAGMPLEGASIVDKRTKAIALTNFRGVAAINGTQPGDILTISFVGYQTKEITLKGNELGLPVILHVADNSLDEMQIIAYGTTTKRLGTGDVSTVKGEDIAKQPVGDVLQALQGRVPGLFIEQAQGGMPGYNTYTLMLRGQNNLSVTSPNNLPLIVIDGVPYNNANMNSFTVSTFLLSNIVNPKDVASIDVLKDADATSIYGSQGANGVILITTKSGKPGPTTFNVSLTRGETGLTHIVPYMNTPQYLAMRKEAFANDGVTPTASNAPDLVSWSQTAYTDYSKLLLQQPGTYTDVEAAAGGGSGGSAYRINLGFNKNTPPIPGNFYNEKGSMSADFNSSSPDGRFNFDFKSGLALTGILGTTYDPTQFEALPPNIPALRNADGSLNWISGIQNPYAVMLNTNNVNMKNTCATVNMHYLPASGLTITLAGNYSYNTTNFLFKSPLAAQNPAYGVKSGYESQTVANTTIFGFNGQAEYTHKLLQGMMTALVVGNFTQNAASSTATNASQFINDQSMGNLGAASSITISQQATKILYGQVIGRFKYNLKDEYLLDLTVDHDGSSSFGPGHRFGTFTSIGAGWVFTKIAALQNALPFLSFGKLRASYGAAGQNGPAYSYLDLYSVYNLYTSYYQGTPALVPQSLYNPALHWATTKKLSGGLDLAFLHDRIQFGGTIFRDRSDGQILGEPLAATTGFGSVNVNSPALVQNFGQEYTLNTVNIRTNKFSWHTTFNISWVHSKLLSYPNLAASPYANSYILGKPINIVKMLRSTGVDPATGVYQFLDKNGKVLPTGTYNYPGDLTKIINMEPRFDGAFNNTLHYGNFSLDLNFTYVSKWTTYPLGGNSGNPPGFMNNQPISVIKDHWQKPGDKASTEKFTEQYGDAGNALFIALKSDLYYTNGSYIRLKTAALSYSLSREWLRHMRLKNGSLSLSAQNLLTITRFPGPDPESGSNQLTPYKTITAGLNVDF